MKVFPDTNVLASAIATRGLCSEVFELVLTGQELMTSNAVLRELRAVLGTKLVLPESVIAGFLALVEMQAEVLEDSPADRIPGIESSDAALLSHASHGGAEVFVTGDKQVLAPGRYRDMSILSPRELWNRLTGPAQ